MLANNNGTLSFNSFIEQPKIPYKIIEFLMASPSESAESFWKLLQYPDKDALDKPKLTVDEKLKLVWTPKQPNWEQEEDFGVFLKPLIGNSLNTAKQQTQLRLFRYGTTPESRMESVIVYEFDVITNEKTSMVYYDGIMCERCDLVEAFILNVLNGADVGIGQNYLRYDRELSRACQSLANISNSKSFFGRSFFLALLYVYPESGGNCG